MITLKGLIIREAQKGESNKLIHVLTAERGVISVYVRGGMKSTKNAAATQLYVYSKFCLEKTVDPKGPIFYYLNSSEPEEMFYELRLDVVKMSLAAYLADLIYYARIEGVSDMTEVLRLTLNTFYFLNRGQKDPEFLKSVFEFRLLCDIGFRPDLLCCPKCYKYLSDKMYLNMAEGYIECEDCCTDKDGMYVYELDRSLLHVIRHIALTDLERLFAVKISAKLQLKLTNLTEGYIRYHFRESFDTLKFYRSIT